MSVQAELLAAPKVPLRYLVRFNPRPAAKSDESCYLPMEAISEFGAVDSSRRRPTSELSQGYSFLADGDVAYAKVTPCFENGKGLRATALPGGHAFATTEITVMRPSSLLHSGYLAWILQSEDFRAPGEAHMSGAGGLKRVPESYAARFQVRHPSIDAQRAVADYLDRETAQIDAFIAKNEELITLLTERRAAAIARTVTGRRSGEVDGRGSSWMRGLPSGWNLLPIKLLAKRVTDGAHISPETEGGEYDFVSTRDISAGLIDYAGSLKTSPRTYSYMVRTGCQPKVGDILYSKDGTIGETAVVREPRPFVVASSLIIITPDPSMATSDYLRYALSSVPLLEQAKTLVRGAGLPRVSIANLATVPVPLPPLAVQNELVAWLDRVTGSIDSAIEIARRSVDLARERRAALISAAVTGKIDIGVTA